MMPDAEVVDMQAAAQGDHAAFERLIARHQARIRAFLAVRLFDRSMADDLAQDTFVVAFRRLHTVDPTRPILPWLRGIAENLLRNHIRKRHPVTCAQDELQALFDDHLQEQAGGQEDDLIEALRHCLDDLGGASARMVRSHYFEGLSLARLADSLQRSIVAVTTALHRARKQLGACVRRRVARGGCEA